MPPFPEQHPKKFKIQIAIALFICVGDRFMNTNILSRLEKIDFL
ncbi:hypothetical protein [Nostoc sp. 106C]|nr:hypothetical protein [Nostoc sp. 106C]